MIDEMNSTHNTAQNCNICLDSTKVEEEVREGKNKVSVLKSQEGKKKESINEIRGKTT